ncbi:MAG: AraC family transcriptional regulator [Bacteroidota bacterium]
MKAAFEKIEPGFGSSFTIKKFENSHRDPSYEWHFHPEYEIVFVSAGKGKRHIGNHISYFENGDLIFLGPNLPHFGFTPETGDHSEEIVLQMSENFLGDGFFEIPEFEKIRQLFNRARSGISFSGNTKAIVGKKLDDLRRKSPFDRLIGLLKILQLLANTREYTMLNASGITVDVDSKEHSRVEMIYNYVQRHYTETIKLDDIADVVSMTVPAFCRYFKQLTNTTFTKFVNEIRIGQASKLLKDSEMSIAEISLESGFNNLSHFNKQFRLVTGQSPSAFRKEAKKTLQITRDGEADDPFDD